MYPSPEEILAEPKMRYRPDVLRFVRRWQREWRGRLRSEDGLAALVTGIADLYEQPVLVTFEHTIFGPYYAHGVIRLPPGNRGSVVTALHELAHHLFGESERKACRWSVHLFRRLFPRTFARGRFVGHLFVVDRPERAVRVREDGDGA